MNDAATSIADASADELVEALTAALIERPDSSLRELARVVGVGRTTLHRRFATREDVMRAVALHALDRLSTAYADAGLADAFRPPEGADADATSASGVAAIRSAVGHLIPAGPSLTFLLRAGELSGDIDLDRRTREVDAPMLDAIARGIATGAFSRRFSASWLLETLYALVYVAWEQIERGSLAPLDAGDLVIDTWLRGVTARA